MATAKTKNTYRWVVSEGIFLNQNFQDLDNWHIFRKVKMKERIEEIIKIKGEREKNQPTFVLWITRLPMSLEQMFCTFSNSPIHTNK